MNKPCCFLVSLWLIAYCAAKADPSHATPKENYYCGGNARGLYYAELLIERSAGKERELYEVNFVSRIFNYWFLLEKKELEKDNFIEVRLKKILKAGIIRETLWGDPLGRHIQIAGRLAGPKRYIIDEQNYDSLVKDFRKYISLIKDDSSIVDILD